MKSCHTITSCLIVLIVWLATATVFSPVAYAHKASIFAWVQGDVIHTQSKLSGGKRPQQALVQVFDANGTRLLEGKTDAQGKFSFPAPQQSDLKIVLNAGLGHRAVWTLGRDDFEAAQAETAAGNSREIADQSKTHGPLPPEIREAGSEQSGLSREEITELVGAAMDRKLAPVMAKLADMDQRRVQPADILGGLGYILGLVGLAAYIHYRRKTESKTR